MTPLHDPLVQQELSLSSEQETQIWAYCQLLWDWNTKLNLTRHVDAATFVTRDVVDAARLCTLLGPREKILDIGSGGGLPGMLVSILRPEVDVTLCDAIQKKTKALEDMVRRLDLPTRVITGRVQDVLAGRRFDTLVARAVGPMAKILGWVKPHWRSFDRLLLIKGPRWIEERLEARHRGMLHSLELRKVLAYPMPGTESESVILSVTHR